MFKRIRRCSRGFFSVFFNFFYGKLCSSSVSLSLGSTTSLGSLCNRWMCGGDWSHGPNLGRNKNVERLDLRHNGTLSFIYSLKKDAERRRHEGEEGRSQGLKSNERPVNSRDFLQMLQKCSLRRARCAGFFRDFLRLAFLSCLFCSTKQKNSRRSASCQEPQLIGKTDGYMGTKGSGEKTKQTPLLFLPLLQKRVN